MSGVTTQDSKGSVLDDLGLVDVEIANDWSVHDLNLIDVPLAATSEEMKAKLGGLDPSVTPSSKSDLLEELDDSPQQETNISAPVTAQNIQKAFEEALGFAVDAQGAEHIRRNLGGRFRQAELHGVLLELNKDNLLDNPQITIFASSVTERVLEAETRQNQSLAQCTPIFEASDIEELRKLILSHDDTSVTIGEDIYTKEQAQLIIDELALRASKRPLITPLEVETSLRDIPGVSPATDTQIREICASLTSRFQESELQNVLHNLVALQGDGPHTAQDLIDTLKRKDLFSQLETKQNEAMAQAHNEHIGSIIPVLRTPEQRMLTTSDIEQMRDIAHMTDPSHSASVAGINYSPKTAQDELQELGKHTISAD
ncbi:MAG: hypothetical protein KDD55_01005 [Bdellovibrionales bacterium]|nr:hypothetical protein [Bdellovibrionales bacterium]